MAIYNVTLCKWFDPEHPEEGDFWAVRVGTEEHGITVTMGKDDRVIGVLFPRGHFVTPPGFFESYVDDMVDWLLLIGGGMIVDES